MSRVGRALVVWMALSSPSLSFAYELTETVGGTPLVWDQRAPPYDVVFDLADHDGQALSSATRAAFDTWAFASQAGLRPDYRGPAQQGATQDGLSTVSIDAVWDPAFGDPDRAVAFAWVQYDPNSGVIREGDVHLNGARFSFADRESGAFDTQSVVLHELGHVLGLAHSCGDPGATHPSCFSVPDEPEGRRDEILEAVMAPTLSTGRARRVPNADDLAGLRTRFDGGGGGGATHRPMITEVGRACPFSWWTVGLAVAPARPVSVELRYPSGVRGNRSIDIVGDELRVFGPEPVEYPLEILVLDPRYGAYDAWLVEAAPAACAPSERPVVPGVTPDSGGGCTCSPIRPNLSRRDGLWAVILGVLVMSIRRRVRPAVLVLAALVLPVSASAFECSRTGMTIGPSLVWGEREVSWYAGEGLFAVVGDEAVGEAQVMGSFAAWADVECSDLSFPFLGVRNVRAGFNETGDNDNVVVLVKSLWPYQAGAIAVTTTAYDTRDGTVVDADIEVNGQGFRFVHVEDGFDCGDNDNVMDLRNALTHEVGHMVGLEHPPDTLRYAESTMYASAPACETKKRTLAEDDIEGLCFIYPRGEPTQQCYPPNGPNFIVAETDDGFGGCATVPEDAGLWSLVLLIGLTLRRRT